MTTLFDLAAGSMSTTREQAAALAVQHGIQRSTDRAAFLANAFSKIGGIDGDETLELIADLLNARVISKEDATAMVLSHIRERRRS